MKTFIRAFAIVAASMLLGTQTTADEPDTYMMQLPPEVRKWFVNPNGSCVQCSIGMVGTWNNVPAATTLLWDTVYGPAVRGGSGPSRVTEYCERRKIQAWNITGGSTAAWMEWAAKTGRFAAVGAGVRHFQTEYGRDKNDRQWYVCNNNSTQKIDEYSDSEYTQLHQVSGQWVVILKGPAPPPPPEYRQWWQTTEN